MPCGTLPAWAGKLSGKSTGTIGERWLMATKKDGGNTHPGNTELTTIREVEIEVNGKTVLIEVEIPIPCRVVCGQCGAEVEWYRWQEEDGTVVVKIIGPTCGCMGREG